MTNSGARPDYASDGATSRGTAGRETEIDDSTEDGSVPESAEDGSVPESAEDRSVPESAEDGSVPPEDLAVLVVGPFQRGGINSYMEEQIRRLEDDVTVSSHDTVSAGLGTDDPQILRGILWGLFAMVRFFFRTPPDTVHVHSSYRYSFYRASVYVLYAKYVWGIPVVLHVHGSSFDEFVTTRSRPVASLQRFVFGGCDEIIVLSEYWREVISDRADAEKIRVIPNAVDPARFPTGNEDDGPHVVFMSSLIERKGVPELTTAIERLTRRQVGDVRVSIAGDGPQSERVERLSEQYDHVEYLGYVPEEQKRSLLRDGSIYVLPTHAEGLPIAMLEGMAAGNAVVSTTVGSIPEVVGADRGILVEPGDVDGLVDALEELVTSPGRRREMAANNRRAVEERYSWNRVVDELNEVYRTHARR